MPSWSYRSQNSGVIANGSCGCVRDATSRNGRRSGPRTWSYSARSAENTTSSSKSIWLVRTHTPASVTELMVWYQSGRSEGASQSGVQP